jgi:glycosyltransferase involved in cell wall biosynthesis
LALKIHYMNIVWISYYPLDLSEHPAPWIITLAKGLVQEGHSLTILTVSSKIKEIKKLKSADGYEVIVVPYRGGVFHLLGLFNTRINALKRFIENYEGEMDVIHIHGTEHQFASSLLRVQNKIPYIISVQGIISLYKAELRRKLSPVYLFWSISSFYEKNEIKNADNFFCRTHWDRGFVKSINSRAKINLGWEMIRPEFFEYRHDFEGKGILFMGGASFLKALNICLQTFDMILNQMDTTLHIVGNSDRDQITKICGVFGLKNITDKNVILHGKLDAEGICNVYSQCFCLYHPSLIDNSPNSICEAQVAGLPVIATNVGGVSSLIVDGETGILVEKNDVAQHKNAILDLFGKDNFRRYLSSRSILEARVRHDKNLIVKQTIDTYKKLANNSV